MTTRPNEPQTALRYLPHLDKGVWVGSLYLPIENFRRDENCRSGSHGNFTGSDVARVFRSSGTTGSTRATSLFSSKGLANYRQESVRHFFEVLDQMQPGPPAVGVSLIPRPTEEGWGESSLAQMVSWLAEVRPVKFVTSAELEGMIATMGDQPVWLFGTAFHWLNVIDAGQTRKLPAGSVIFETGGTKGKAREVTREKLYSELAAAFGIPERSIASEYGMSELACQAYDFLPIGQDAPSQGRSFRFAESVKIAVLEGPGVASAYGRGALLVSDVSRVDYPWPIRTEDLVDLDGSTFKLLGRAPVAPLKGCSLLAEDLTRILPVSMPSNKAPTKSLFEYFAYDKIRNGATLRAHHLHSIMTTTMRGLTVPALLEMELCSQRAAASAMADLSKSLPKTESLWLAAAETATGGRPIPCNWTFIFPDNHSLVGLQALSLAYVLGLKVTARLPRRFAYGDNLLANFVEMLMSLPQSLITTVGPSFRLGQSKGADADGALMVFGSDDTVAAIKAGAGGPVQAFGHRVGLSVISESNIGSSAAELVRDCLSLGQAGCMATRLILILGNGSGKTHPVDVGYIARRWQTAASDFWGCPLPWKERVGQDMEAVRLRAHGAEVWGPRTPDEPLVAWRSIATPAEVRPLSFKSALDIADSKAAPDIAGVAEAMIARAPFTLSAMHLGYDASGLDALDKVLTHFRDSGALGTVTAPESILNLPLVSRMRSHLPGLFRSLGQANAPEWNGLHEGRFLFDPTP